MKINIKKWSLITMSLFAFCVILWGAIDHKKNVKEKHQMEARFDKFMGYYYPILEDFAKASDIYKRMEISLMYDYISYGKGRYIDEIVNYYDGGSFSMRDHFNLMRFLDSSTGLYASRSCALIRQAPDSRREEAIACNNILDCAKELAHTDIYDSDIALYEKQEKVKDLLDSLNFEIHLGVHNLSKYKKQSTRININDIPEYEYDLANY